MHFIYLIIGLYFPTEFGLDPIQTGQCFLTIGLCYITGGFLGSILAKFTYGKISFTTRMILSLFPFIFLAVGNFLVGWSLPQGNFWLCFSFILGCAALRGFILPGAVSYTIELQGQQTKSILDGLAVIQIFMSFLAQMIGTLLDSQVPVYWTFTVISILMVCSCVPVLFFVIKRKCCS